MQSHVLYIHMEKKSLYRIQIFCYHSAPPQLTQPCSPVVLSSVSIHTPSLCFDVSAGSPNKLNEGLVVNETLNSLTPCSSLKVHWPSHRGFLLLSVCCLDCSYASQSWEVDVIRMGLQLPQSHIRMRIKGFINGALKQLHSIMTELFLHAPTSIVTSC